MFLSFSKTPHLQLFIEKLLGSRQGWRGTIKDAYIPEIP
jgi:hypothetical protein